MEKEVDSVNHISSSQENEVFETIHAIMHLYRAQQYKSLRGTAHELTHMENKVLGYFARHPGATQRDLALRSGRDKAQVTRLVQGLREKGLIEARADEADRRSSRMFLTPEGEAVHAALREHGAQLATQALAGLDEQERAQLGALLLRVQANLSGEAG